MNPISPINRSQVQIDQPAKLEFDSDSATPRILGRQFSSKVIGTRSNSIKNQNLKNAAKAYNGQDNQMRDRTFGPKMPATTSNGKAKYQNL